MKQAKSKKYSEKLVHKYLKLTVETSGGLIFKNHPLTNAGIPDTIVHHRGMTFYVETKTTGEECTPIQKEFHKKLKAKGIETYVLDVKITNFWDIMLYGYTTYEGKHYSKNPFKDK